MERNILLIAPTRIGDAVLATSILEHVRRTAPDAKVTLVTSTLSAPLYEGFSNTNRIIAIDKQHYSMHWWHIWRSTIGTKWDAVWDLRGSATSYVLRTKARHVFRGCDDPMPKVKQYEKVFGISALPFPVLHTRPEDDVFAAQRASSVQKILALAPCANWEPKEWPMEHFITLAESLCLRKNLRPMIICAGHERPRAMPLLNALARFTPIDLTQGDAHLLAIEACLKNATLFIGNDSGLMHMAAAAGIHALGLFGPTPHSIYQPFGERSSYIIAPEGVLANLSVAMVQQHVENMLLSA